MMHDTESVWDYPRPPALRGTTEVVEVHFGEQLIARTDRPIQVLETSHPPTYYLPRSAFAAGVLQPVAGRTMCEFKGQASYFDVVVAGSRAPRAAWHYPQPTSGFADLLGHIALMPGAMQACYVDGEQVQSQDGDFYGGWITSKVRGPFKGAPGTLGW